jgi:NAD(P)-dependent dehydrogenase (short-subunit alcohol dehydrogenase family)
MAHGLAGAGSRIVIVGRDAQQLAAAATRLRSETGAEIAYVAWDLSRVESLGDLIAAAADCYGRLDVLVNNAGVQVRKPFLEITPADYDYVLGVNLRAVFFLGQQAARHMISHSTSGKIINVSSLTCRMGIPDTGPYGASKGGVYSLTKNMAVELAKYDIRVNAIAPGYFHTRLTAAAFEDPDRRAWMESRIPLGKFGNPDDLAGAVVFLASNASNYMTGNVIFVDGGWTSG